MSEHVNEVARPSKCTAGELGKAGVTLVSEEPLFLQCDQCGQQWSPDLGRGGRLPRGYWHCPNGCNVP
jgi:hypothetical protein